MALLWFFLSYFGIPLIALVGFMFAVVMFHRVSERVLARREAERLISDPANYLSGTGFLLPQEVKAASDRLTRRGTRCYTSSLMCMLVWMAVFVAVIVTGFDADHPYRTLVPLASCIALVVIQMTLWALGSSFYNVAYFFDEEIQKKGLLVTTNSATWQKVVGGKR